MTFDKEGNHKGEVDSKEVQLFFALASKTLQIQM